jgi:hypothetical protein
LDKYKWKLFFSYAENASGHHGIFIDTHIVGILDTFEIEIVSLGRGGGIGNNMYAITFDQMYIESSV